MDDFTFSKATEADVTGIQFTAEESWRATYKDIFTESFISTFLARAYSTENLKRSVNSQRTTFLVAKEDDFVVVGFCHFGPNISDDGIELYRLYVDPDYWRLGIGGRLLALMETHLREQGIDEYYCYVHGRNEVGKAFYVKSGFQHDPARDKPADEEWYMVKRL